MASPLVSVVLANHNCEPPDSLSAQTFVDYEVLTTGSRNQGLAEARGEYVAFFDFAHNWHPRKLEKQLLLLTGNPAMTWCYCGASPLPLPHLSGQILRPLLLQNFIPPGSVVARREVLQSIGGFNQNLGHPASEEWDLWLRLSATHDCGFVAEPLIDLRQSTASAEEIERLCEANLRVVESTVLAFRRQLTLEARSQALASVCVEAGNRLLQAQRRSEARHKYAEALTHNPLRPDAYLNWVSSYLSPEAQRQMRDLQALTRFTHNSEKRPAKSMSLKP